MRARHRTARRGAIVALAALLLSVAGLAGVRAATAHADAAPPEPLASPLTLDSLHWLAGLWEGPLGDAVAEEVWLPPRDGSVVALFRLMRQGRTTMTEHITVYEENAEVVLRFKHFNPDYTTWEKDDPLTFRLTEAGERRLVFTGAPGQRPSRLEYRLLDDDRMLVRVGEPDDPPLDLRLTRTARFD